MSFLDRQRAAAEGNMLAAKIRSLEATIGALRKEVKDAKHQRDELAEALRGLSFNQNLSKPCFCRSHDPDEGHQPSCRAANAALKRMEES